MATGRRVEKKEETKGIQGQEKSVTESLAGRKERPRRVGETEEEGRKEERREEKGEDEGDGRSKGEASKRVGRNDRLGCGREEMDAREWRGGQKVGSNQDQSGFLDQEV